ncbi:MAG: HU family DNA-binding protein [Paludibacteraceae bacterium]|nr:HU family DNA-binding protein [Paludibacteraceae bacterium]
MADKKITIATLRKMLAKQTGMPESKTGEFLDNFFKTIVSGLKEDGQVRLNGFGTFKVQDIKPRKSINIKTGESFIIDGYNKVVFTAEPAVKEQANHENAKAKPVKLPATATVTADSIDPLKKLGEQAEEIKDILAELGVTQETAETEETNPVAETTTETVTEQTTETPVTPIVTEVPEQPETPATTATEPETAAPEETKAEEKEPENEKKDKEFHPWKVAGITILIFCILLIGAYFFLKHKLTSWADSLLNRDNTQEAVSTPQPAQPETDTTPLDTTTLAEEEPTEETQTEAAPAEPETELQKQWFGETRTYEDFIKTETLGEGSRLTHLSRKYYGAPDFWVYIYEANKSRIPNPNKIGKGTKLRIPDLPPELTDTNNEQAMKQARELHNKILGKE